MSDLEIQSSSSNSASDHVTAWLGAYHDGELNAAHRARVEAHLAGCADCQRELMALRELTLALQSAPLPLTSQSDAEYARALVGRITRPAPPLWQRGLRFAWRFAPLFLFAAWAFFQTVQWLSGLLLLGLRLVPGLEGLLPAAPAVSESLLLDLLRFGLQGRLNVDLVEQLSQFQLLDSLSLLNLAVLSILAVLFLSWIASWWAFHRARVARQL